MSKAAVRSSRMRMVMSTESAAMSRSSVILIKAVLVLCGDGNQTGIVCKDCFGIGGNGVEWQKFMLVIFNFFVFSLFSTFISVIRKLIECVHFVFLLFIQFKLIHRHTYCPSCLISYTCNPIVIQHSGIAVVF